MEGSKITIEIQNLSKKIKKADILEEINLRMEGGRIYGLRGKNGSGKTMLMRAICGLILPTKGKVIIGGEELGKDISFPRSIGVLIENPSFLNTHTGYKNLEILADINGKINEEQINNTLQSVGLEPMDKRKYKKYSLGMKQRLGIACAVMEQPDIIILDEPINALDEAGVQQVRAILKEHKERGALIIVACHDKEELELLADEIYYIENGRIINEGGRYEEKSMESSS